MVPGMKRALVTMVWLTACGVETAMPDPVDPTPQQEMQPQQPEPPQQPEQPQEPAPTGFPCDVQAVLEQNCAACHTGTRYVRVFTTRADFLQVDSTGQTLGQHAVEKMSDRQAPMPPAEETQRPSADQKATIAAWVSAGMPAGTCGALTPPQ